MEYSRVPDATVDTNNSHRSTRSPTAGKMGKMDIPVLTHAFFVCDLKTGCMIIACLQMILHSFMAFFAVIAVSLLVMTSPWLAYGLSKEADDTRANQAIVQVIIILLGAVVVIMRFVGAYFLLIGVQRKKPGMIKTWLVFAIISLIFAIPSLTLSGILDTYGDLDVGGMPYFFINLYLTWVVYSYYRQLKAGAAEQREALYEA